MSIILHTHISQYIHCECVYLLFNVCNDGINNGSYDILIVYNTLHTDINKALSEFNNVHQKIQFSIKEENNKQINFLDLSITRIHNSLQFGIFRKPTATDIMIHNTSCHLIEHKISGISYLINRAITYPILEDSINKEKQTTDYLLKVNGYHHLIASELIQHTKKR
jgi:hypothetical protein